MADSSAKTCDPSKDPARKAKSTDPAWKYGFWPDLNSKVLIQCILCGKKVHSGVSRLKQHLVGGFADVVVCSNTTPTIIKEIKDYMQKYIEKKAKKNYVLQLKDDGYEKENRPIENQSTGASNTLPSPGISLKRKAAFQFAVPQSEPLKTISSMIRKTSKKEPGGVPFFIHINQNVSSGKKVTRQNNDDIAICECKYDAKYPDIACGEMCLNVLTSTECVPGYCPCGEYCKNQRFQKCQYAQTKLFRTEGRGWGLLAGQYIKAGEFIIEYCGEVISSKEANQRLQTYEAQGLWDAYMISLNANFFIDATKKGNMARFINHSCQPNCETRKWTVFGETRIGIFAKQDITVGTELAYDYNFEWYGGANVRCLCGAPNCSIFLGAKSHGFQEHNHVWEDGDDRYTVDTFPLYDSAEDEPFPKHLKSESLTNNTMYMATGNEDNSMKVDGFSETNYSTKLTNIIAEPFGSVAVEGLPINAVNSDVKEETDLFTQKTQQDSMQVKTKQAGRKQVNGKNVAKLFASKQAQEEIIRCEEVRTEAFKKLNDLYDEIRPSIEEHAKDSQDN